MARRKQAHDFIMLDFLYALLSRLNRINASKFQSVIVTHLISIFLILYSQYPSPINSLFRNFFIIKQAGPSSLENAEKWENADSSEVLEI